LRRLVRADPYVRFIEPRVARVLNVAHYAIQIRIVVTGGRKTHVHAVIDAPSVICFRHPRRVLKQTCNFFALAL
jgi:hypothetical protein